MPCVFPLLSVGPSHAALKPGGEEGSQLLHRGAISDLDQGWNWMHRPCVLGLWRGRRRSRGWPRGW